MRLKCRRVRPTVVVYYEGELIFHIRVDIIDQIVEGLLIGKLNGRVIFDHFKNDRYFVTVYVSAGLGVEYFLLQNKSITNIEM